MYSPDCSFAMDSSTRSLAVGGGGVSTLMEDATDNANTSWSCSQRETRGTCQSCFEQPWTYPKHLLTAIGVHVFPVYKQGQRQQQYSARTTRECTVSCEIFLHLEQLTSVHTITLVTVILV